jgi:hypothetical protein
VAASYVQRVSIPVERPFVTLGLVRFLMFLNLLVVLVYLGPVLGLQ